MFRRWSAAAAMMAAFADQIAEDLRRHPPEPDVFWVSTDGQIERAGRPRER